jgi:hypothetical protein
MYDKECKKANACKQLYAREPGEWNTVMHVATLAPSLGCLVFKLQDAGLVLHHNTWILVCSRECKWGVRMLFRRNTRFAAP